MFKGINKIRVVRTLHPSMITRACSWVLFLDLGTRINIFSRIGTLSMTTVLSFLISCVFTALEIEPKGAKLHPQSFLFLVLRRVLLGCFLQPKTCHPPE